jgi:hypothetical protein
MKIVKVRIKWLKKSKKQINSLMSSDKYSTVIKFENEQENWVKDAWSIVLNNLKINDSSDEMMGQMRFLSPNAPEDRLYKNNKFELYEGRSCVAKGVVIDDCNS